MTEWTGRQDRTDEDVIADHDAEVLYWSLGNGPPLSARSAYESTEATP